LEDEDVKLTLRLSPPALYSLIGLLVTITVFSYLAGKRTATSPMYVGTTGVQERVVTKEFVLVDDSGNTRVRIAMNENDAPAVQMFDKSGKQRAQLRLNKNDVPSLRLYDSAGTLRSVTGFNLHDGTPAFVEFDANGIGRAINTMGGRWRGDFHDEDQFPNGFGFNNSELEKVQSFPYMSQEIAPETIQLDMRRAETEMERARVEAEKAALEMKISVHHH
jgi:hypothetical protein